MIKRLKQFFTFCMLAVCVSCGGGETLDPEPEVESSVKLFINEIHATGTPDWLEIYNEGDADVSLEGYRVYDDLKNKYTLPAGIIVGAKGYKVLFCDGKATGDHTNFKLSSKGETVWLESNMEELVDKVIFPETSEGSSYGRFGDGSDNWKISGVLTQGLTNGTSEEVSIIDVDRSPKVVTSSDKVTISVELSDTDIKSAEIIYRIDNRAEINMAMMKNTDSTYVGEIPSLTEGGEVTYYVKVTTNSDVSLTSPLDPTKDTFDYLVNNDPLPSLFINEFLANNKSCCPDKSSGQDEFDDWLEIYNGGSEAVDLGSFFLSDDPDKPFGYKIPKDAGSTTVIQPGGFLLLWADDQKEQGALHMNFKLGKDGETIGLYYIDGRTIDQYTYGPQQDDISTGRTKDGAMTWKTIQSPTPNASNN